MGKRVAFLLVIAVFAAILPVSAATQPQKITVGIRPAFSAIPVWVAMDLGFFKAEGLDVTWRQVKAEESVPAVLTGSVQYMAYAGTGPWSAALQGIPIRFVAAFGTDHTALIGRVKDAKDLAGKTIVTLRLGDHYYHYQLAKYLEANGINANIEFVGGATTALQALRAGKVDAIAISSVAVVEPQYSPEVTFAEILGAPLPPRGVLWTTEARVRDNPEEVRKMVAAIRRATIWLLEHPKAATEYLAKFYEVDFGEKSKEFAPLFYALGLNCRRNGVLDLSATRYDPAICAPTWTTGAFTPGDIALLADALRFGQTLRDAPVPASLVINEQALRRVIDGRFTK